MGLEGPVKLNSIIIIIKLFKKKSPVRALFLRIFIRIDEIKINNLPCVCEQLSQMCHLRSRSSSLGHGTIARQGAKDVSKGIVGLN